ncbi:MAG: hypothetical protein LBV72_12840 [Tannerella sp.]|jgi:hypothetical protein|nr:hypothetical protein [Tannerella sp.]
MKTFKFLLLIAAVLTTGTIFFACSDDDDLKPITLKYLEDTTISLYYPNNTGYSFPVEGGDGHYSVKSSDNDVVKAEMISPIDFRLEIVGIGETTVTVTDNSQNSLTLNVVVDYESHSFAIKQHDVTVVGDGLTENEKKAIREAQLARIPVKVGGGYKFIFTDPENGKGKAIIYTDTFGGTGIETTFECKMFEYKNDPLLQARGYEIVINNEKRTFILDRYTPTVVIKRYSENVTMALMEDVTLEVQLEYPKAETVYSSQVIEVKTY